MATAEHPPELAPDGPLCGAQHPMHRHVRCTLPDEHGPVLVGLVQVDHVMVTPDEERAWIVTK